MKRDADGCAVPGSVAPFECECVKRTGEPQCPKTCYDFAFETEEFPKVRAAWIRFEEEFDAR